MTVIRITVLTIISLFIAVPVKKKLDLSKSQSSNTLIGSRVTLPCLNRRRSLDKETSSTTRGDETKSIASEEYSTEKRHINTTMIKKRTRMYQKVRENTNMAASFQESGREKGKPQIGTRKTLTTQCWLLYSLWFLLRQTQLTIAR